MRRGIAAQPFQGRDEAAEFQPVRPVRGREALLQPLAAGWVFALLGKPVLERRQVRELVQGRRVAGK